MDYQDFRELATAKIKRLLCKPELYQRQVQPRDEVVTARNVQRQKPDSPTTQESPIIHHRAPVESSSPARREEPLGFDLDMKLKEYKLQNERLAKQF